MIVYCQFHPINALEVQCPACKRAFSGKPEQYNGRIICAAQTDGPGTELEKIFKWWADKLKLDFKSCGACKGMRLEMDVRGKEWVRGNIEILTEGILKNSKAAGIKVPAWMIRKWLKKVSR